MLLYIATFILFGLPANDIALPAELNFEKALDIFHTYGFDLLVAETTVNRAQGDLRIAGSVNNPQLGGSVGKSYNYTCTSPGCTSTSWGASLSDQDALFDVLSGKRGLRVDVAKAALLSTIKSRDDTLRTLDALLAQLFLNVAIDQQNLAFHQALKKNYTQTTKLFNLRYQNGDISEADLARIEIVELEEDQTIDSAQQTLRLDKLALAFMLGLRNEVPDYHVNNVWLEQVFKNPLETLSLPVLLNMAKNKRPDLQAQLQQINRATNAIDLTYRMLFPDTTLSLGFTQEGTGQNAIQPPTFILGLTLNVPVLYQYQGELTKAKADLQAQTILYQKNEAQIINDVASAYATLVATTSRLQRMREQLRSRANRILELVIMQYKKGATSLLDLLDAQRTYIAINQEYFADLNDYWLSIFQLKSATAMEIKP